MVNEIGWLALFFVAYWAFCIVMAVRSSRLNANARHFFIPAGGISSGFFVFAVTAATFAGWIFTSQPGQIFREGFQYLNASYFVISIPLAGVFVLKRQWILARKYEFVTPGDMYSAYFRGDAIGLLAVGVALLFAIPFLASLLGTSGLLLETLTGGAVSRETAMWVLSSAMLLYCVIGGLAAVAQVGLLQGILFIGGFTIVSFIAVTYAGGFSSIAQSLAQVAATPAGGVGMTNGNGGGDYNGLFAIPGVIQFSAGIGRDTPAGGMWTAVMSLTFVLSMMGIQSAPSNSVWGFSSRSPRAFPIHLIWGSAFCVGVALFIFSPLLGFGGLILGANPEVDASAGVLPELAPGAHGGLVAEFIGLVRGDHAWLFGLLAVAGIAAIQVTAAAYLVTTGNILSRDIYLRYFDAGASWDQQRLVSRIAMLLICLAAVLMASFAHNAVLVLGGLAIPCSFQLLVSLMAVLWLPSITRHGATAGLVAGLFAVIMTEPLGQVLTGNLLPWGRWPWTVHSGMWGMFFNLIVCWFVSASTGADADAKHRADVHAYLNQCDRADIRGGRMAEVAWILVLGWVFFAPGPGSVLGNALFGAPGAGYSAWIFGVPSIWAWQVFWWTLGIGLVWFLAVKMRFSTMPRNEADRIGAANVIDRNGGRNEE